MDGRRGLDAPSEAEDRRRPSEPRRTGSDGGTGLSAAARLLRLQRTAGNRAVTGAVAGTGAAVAVQRADPPGTAPPGVAAPSADFLGAEWTQVAKPGLVYKEEGVFLRDRPLPGSQSGQLARLLQNTRVTIVRSQPVSGWYAVRVQGGRHDGSFGYAAQSHVRDDLPDAGALMHRVTSGETLGRLVQNHPQYASYDIRTGDDARSIAMAVYVANRETGGVRLDEERFAAQNSWWEDLLDTADAYRRETRRIYQSVDLLSGRLIWLPGTTYIDALKSSGIIPSRADWKNAAIEAGKSIGGFSVGLVDGFLGAFADAVEGLYDLGASIVDLVIDVVRGEALRKAQELYDYFDGLTPAELRELAESVVVNLVSALASSLDQFLDRWNAASPYDSWHFRGVVTGTVLAEVAMALLSGGAANAAKWLGKFGRLGNRLRGLVDRVADRIPHRGRRGHDADADLGERGLALATARTIAEAHDEANLPVPAVLAALAPLRRYRGVNGFAAQPLRPGHYRIVMRSVVDDDYTPAGGGGRSWDDLDAETQQGVPMSDREHRRRRDVDREWGLSSPTARGCLPHDGNWLRGGRNVDVFPRRIAERMANREFRDWQEFRETFWRLVAADPELSTHVSLRQWPQARRDRGHAPFTPGSEQGRGVTWQLSHREPVRAGENPYRLDNLELVTPRAHVHLERTD
jgi:hypothetical protein